MITGNSLEHFPDEILDSHQRHFNLPHKKKSLMRLRILRSSIQLSPYLEEPRDVIYDKLLRLYQAYEQRDLRRSLTIINEFSSFPGYPFLSELSFGEHISYVKQYFRQQNQHLPRIPVIAYQKSASSYQSVVLSKLFNINTSVLSFQHMNGMRAWVQAYSKWGGFVHDHYYPSDVNLRLLQEANITKCIIHDRDPIDAFISCAHHWYHLSEYSRQQLNQAQQLELIRDYCDREMASTLQFHALWRRLWNEVAARGQMEIYFTTYEEMKANKEIFFIKLLDFMGTQYSPQQLNTVLTDLDTKKNNKDYNFRKAAAMEWQQILRPDQIARAKKLMASEFPDIPF